MGTMQQFFIDKEHAFEFIRVSKTPVNDKAHLRSRCIDGRYVSGPETPLFTFPGADAGEFLMVTAAAEEYGFEMNREQVYEAICALVGGRKYLQFHTDEHASSSLPLAGCGHIGQMSLAPKDYGVLPEDIAFITTSLQQAQKEGAEQVKLHGDHSEGVVIFVRGPYGVLPQADIMVENRKHHIQAFVYHQTLADQRHKMLARELVAHKALTLPDGCDESYLYQVFADVAEDHLMETLKRLAPGLPIYEAAFTGDGLFEMTDLGFV